MHSIFGQPNQFVYNINVLDMALLETFVMECSNISIRTCSSCHACAGAHLSNCKSFKSAIGKRNAHQLDGTECRVIGLFVFQHAEFERLVQRELDRNMCHADNGRNQTTAPHEPSPSASLFSCQAVLTLHPGMLDG